MLLSTTVALAFVCALAVGALRLLGPRRGATGRAMRIVAKLPLDARRTLYVVEVAGRCLLVGAGDGPLTMLTEVDPARLVVELPSEQTPEQAQWRLAVKRALGGLGR